MSLNCDSDDNIFVVEQTNATIYDVCAMKRHFGFNIFAIQYTGFYFILSLWMRSNGPISITVNLIINGQMSNLTTTTTTSTSTTTFTSTTPTTTPTTQTLQSIVTTPSSKIDLI